MKKLTSLTAPYTSSNLNEARGALIGSNVGRVLSGLELEHIEPVLVTSGTGALALDGSLRLRVLNDVTKLFLALVSAGDWLIIGGDIFRNDDSDRVIRETGSTTLGSPNLVDLSNPFTLDDEGKVVVIYNNTTTAYGIYLIDTYINPSTVILATPPGFANETNLQYAILEPNDNCGIYEVIEVIDNFNIAVDPIKEFPSNQNVITDLIYSVYSPAKVEVSPGKFINNGIIVDTETAQQIDYPASWLLPDAPPLVLYGRTLDERDNSPILLGIASGHYDIPGAVIIATNDFHYTGSKSVWFKAAGHGVEQIRKDIDRIVSGFGSPGWHVKPFEVMVDDIPWPPRLKVKYPRRNDGGFERDTIVGTMSKVSGVDTPGANKYETTILDVPLYPPVVGKDRIDKLIISSRKARDSEYDTHETQDNSGELFLTYKHGIARTFSFDEMDSDQYPINELTTQLAVNTLTSVGAATNSLRSISNHLGITLLVYTDDVVGAGTYTVVVESILPESSGVRVWNPLVIPALANAGEIDVDVDVNGCFHIVWTENFDVYYAKVDPTGTYFIQTKTAVSAAVAATAPKISVSLALNVYIFWYETGTPQLMGTVIKPTGQGTITTIVAQTAIIVAAMTGYDFTITRDSDRLFIVSQEAGSHNVTVMDGAFTIIDSYTIPDYSNLGEISGFLTDYLFLERNNQDEIVLFCSGGVDDHSARRTALCVRLTPSGMSRYDGYIVCDPRHSEQNSNYTIFAAEPLPDGGWLILAGLYDLLLPGPLCTLRLSASLSAIAINHDCLGGVDCVDGDISYINSRGDVLVVNRVNITNVGQFSFFDVELYGNSPLTERGFFSDKINGCEDYDLADIVIPRGGIPVRPGVGMYLAVDALPLIAVLNIGTPDALSLVDGEIGAGIAAVNQSSFGIGITDNVWAIAAIMLIDSIESDGFDPSIDIDSVISVYGSNSNSIWVAITIKEIYRINGRTFIVFDNNTQYNHYKVNFTVDMYVPRPNRPATAISSTAMTIQEIRLFVSTPFIEDSVITSDDRHYVRGVEIRFKQLSEKQTITVGDGLNSFGEFSGAEGINIALREAICNTSDAAIATAYPRGSRKVYVGKGRYRLTGPLHIPGGVDVEFAPGALLLDHYRIPSQRSIYGGGYQPTANTVQGFVFSRTLHLSKNVYYYGITEGSTVYISNTVGMVTTAYETKILKIGNGGYTIHLEDLVGINDTLDVVKIYATGIKVEGIDLKTEGIGAFMSTSRPLVEFKLVDKLDILSSSIDDVTVPAVDYDTVAIDSCKNVFFDNFSVKSDGARYGIRFSESENLRFGYTYAENSNQYSIALIDCLDIRGFSNLIARGSGLPGESIYIEDSSGIFGRFSSDSPVGTGVSLAGTVSLGYDEFFNLYIHDNFIAGLINGGAYEMMLSAMMGWIQAFHAIPWTAVPAGWVDGLVTDFIVDALAST